MPPERNAPCHCGSGKKYKHCCLAKDSAPDPEELYLRQWNRQVEDLMGKLMKHARRHFHKDALTDAYGDFSGLFGEFIDQDGHDEEDPLNLGSPEGQMFVSWFFYFWKPSMQDEDPEKRMEEITPAQSLLANSPQSLTPFEKAFIQTCSASFLSFYEIIGVEKEKGLLLRDLFTDREFLVNDKIGAQHSLPGEIQFALVVEWEGRRLYEALSPYTINPEGKEEILATRKRLAQANDFSPSSMRNLDLDLLKLHGDLTSEPETENAVVEETEDEKV